MYSAGQKAHINVHYIVAIVAPRVTEDQSICYIELADRDGRFSVNMSYERMVLLVADGSTVS